MRALDNRLSAPQRLLLAPSFDALACAVRAWAADPQPVDDKQTDAAPATPEDDN